MRKFFQCIYSLFFLASLCTILTGCFSEPPDVASVEEHFRNNQEDIQTVVDFIINSEFSSVSISTADGTMLADLERVEIENEDVNSAIKRLLGHKPGDRRQYYSIYRSLNTIEFSQWSNSHDIGCGLAYSISGEFPPIIQYCTELVPLTEEGWYYYIDDYNSWRTGKRPQTD